MRSTGSVVSTVAAALTTSLLVACGGGSHTEDPTASTKAASTVDSASFCDTFCRKNHDCDSATDLDTCAATCNGEVGVVMTKLRSDVVASIEGCVAEADCRAVLSEGLLTGCTDEAKASVAPSDATRSFCDTLGASSSKCDVTFDHADCLGRMKIFGDDTVTRAETCTTKSCSAIAPCVEANF